MSRGLVPRETLHRRLAATPSGGVILVCAPAGSGKTQLLRSWVEGEEFDAGLAWVSVERDEHDEQRFWLGVVNALAVATGGSVEPVRPAPAFRGEVLVESLISQLRSLEDPVLLVIDDVHELHAHAALGCLEMLLAHLPPTMRVALVTREDPGLGLHRLRLDGLLVEIREPDLRFTPDESRELLEGAGIVLSERGLASLHERTEGWAAGLRLAAISLARHPDHERFVAEFSGSERTVAGYLMAEVLERQPPEVRDLLLRISILDRVTGPLADRLTGLSGSERILQELETANAFVTSLDVPRTQFRLHPLFSDLLRLELRRTAPELVAPLHSAAAAWYEEHGFGVEAVRHAQAAGDWAGATRLLADNAYLLILDGRSGAAHSLLAAFPPDAAESDPELALVFASARVFDGALEEGAAYVALAERAGTALPADRQRRFELLLPTVKLWVAYHRGDLGTAAGAIESVRSALADPAGERLPPDDVRALARMILGIAETWTFQLDDARSDLERALAQARAVNRPYLEAGCLAHLGIGAAFSALPLSEGLDLSEKAVAIAGAHGWSHDWIVAPAFAGGAVLLARLARFAECEEWLESSEAALTPPVEPGTKLLSHLAEGLLRFGQGRFEEALASFRAGEGLLALLADGHPLTLILRGRTLEAQIRLGEAPAVRAALAEMSEEERGRPEIRLAAAALAVETGDPEEALSLLGALIEDPARAHPPRWAPIEALLLEALARERLGEPRAAGASLERALELAEPEGLILPFTLVPVRELLERHSGHRTAHAALRATILDVISGSAPEAGEEARAPVEDLSEAELRVVRFLPGNLKAPEIAAELSVSPNTVRTHLRHIYAKLGAHSRRQAVERARALRLLAPAAASGNAIRRRTRV